MFDLIRAANWLVSQVYQVIDSKRPLSRQRGLTPWGVFQAWASFLIVLSGLFLLDEYRNKRRNRAIALQQAAELERHRIEKLRTEHSHLLTQLYTLNLKPAECSVCLEEGNRLDESRWPQVLPQPCTEAAAEQVEALNAELCMFPNRTSQVCSHDLDVCSSCIATHISVKVADNDISRICCPSTECDRILSSLEIQRLASPETFERYQDLLNRGAATEDANFRHCLRPGCGNGATYEAGSCSEGSPRITCNECQYTMCLQCQVPWHEEQTCDEYQSHVKHGDPRFTETNSLIEQTSKSCPKCGVRITKGYGCFHMTCKCGHEFCWECLANWHAVRLGTENHLPECIFYMQQVVVPTNVFGTDVHEAVRTMFH